MSNQQIPRPDNCPHCGVSLWAVSLDPIDDEHTVVGRYRREIGIEVQGVYDGVLFWQCPDCGGTWQRFDITSRMFHQAAKYMTGEDHA